MRFGLITAKEMAEIDSTASGHFVTATTPPWMQHETKPTNGEFVNPWTGQPASLEPANPWKMGKHAGIAYADEDESSILSAPVDALRKMFEPKAAATPISADQVGRAFQKLTSGDFVDISSELRSLAQFPELAKTPSHQLGKADWDEQIQALTKRSLTDDWGPSTNLIFKTRTAPSGDVWRDGFNQSGDWISSRLIHEA